MEGIKRNYDLVTCGEIMLRLSPPRYERLSEGDVFEKHAGGAELNVASGAAQLGLLTAVVSKLPKNEMGAYIGKHVQYEGVSSEYLFYDKRPQARLGIYYYETAAAPRKPRVIYDRALSSINSLCCDDLPETFWTSTRMFHVSGITLGLSETLRLEIIHMIKKMREHGSQISFDVNYRANLWDEQTARRTIEKVLPLTDILFVSEESCRRMFQKKGTVEEMMKTFSEDFNVKIVATTQRTVHSPSCHDFTSIIYDAHKDKFYTEEPYRGIEVIDRIGSGDAYVAGVLYGLLQYDDAATAMHFGNAMSSMKNTVPGDQPSATLTEIEELIHRHMSTEKGSEMER